MGTEYLDKIKTDTEKAEVAHYRVRLSSGVKIWYEGYRFYNPKRVV